MKKRIVPGQKIPDSLLKRRGSLAELTCNSPLLLQKQTLDISHLPSLSDLPQDLRIFLLSFLPATDLLHSAQLLSKDWHRLANTPVLWQWLRDVPLAQQVQLLRYVSERRSKGKLFFGRMRSTGQRVTMRVVSTKLANAGFDDGVPTSLLRDAAYLSDFQHPNVVKLLSCEVSGSLLWMCYEYKPQSLADVLKNESLSKPVVQSCLRQLLLGLSALHQCGFMHRNLKPDNLLIDENGLLSISDFTLARFTSPVHRIYTPEDPKDRERSGREARRLWYRAPEFLLRNEQYNCAVDMWSVGCLLAELCLGRPLFCGATEIEQLFQTFRLTGVPERVDPVSVNAFPRWPKVQFCDWFDDQAALVAALTPARKTTLALLEQVGNVVGRDGLDLLQRLLDTDPEARPSAAEALAHPFLSTPTVELPRLQLYLATLLNREEFTAFNYLQVQPTLSPRMRTILIDWVIDVGVHFELADETVHLAVRLADKAMNSMLTDRSQLQLIGVACLKIADSLNERSREYYRQESSIEYAYITADEYTPAEVVSMEKRILNLLQFKLLVPTTSAVLNTLLSVYEVDAVTAERARFLADLSLLSYDALQYTPALLANACLFLACCSTEQFPPPVPYALDFSSEAFQAAVDFLKELWTDSRTSPELLAFDAINQKYPLLTPESLWPPVTRDVSWPSIN